MRKYTHLWLLFFVTTASFAQLFVKDNSYVFNKGTVVFVKNEVNLQGDNDANGTPGNFYLRNEGQLLQGAATTTSANTGAGKLSVFQEGTCNEFAYNYWCSPIGNASTTVGNENFGITMFYVPTSNITSNAATPLPVSDRNGLSGTGSLSIARRWIWKYIASNIYNLNGGGWQSVYAASSLAPGEGFTMKGVSGSDATTIGEATAVNPGNNQRYDFRGKPNDGDISITVANVAGPDYTNQTLTGNPYPSAINLNLFLLENSGYTVNYTTGAISPSPTFPSIAGVITGYAYFWEHNKALATSHLLTSYSGGYGTYVPNNTNAFSPGTYTNATWNTYNADGTPNTTGTFGSAGTERYKRMFTPIGQGFMVEGNVATGTAVMKNKYRAFVKEGAANNSQFERNSSTQSTNWDPIPNVAGVDYTQFSKEQVPQIRIHTIINDQFTRENVIAFNPFTTDGYDLAMDARSNDSNLPNDAYLSLPNDTNQYVISTLPFDIDKRIPFTVRVNAGQSNFRVTVGESINFTGSNNVYIYDGATGVYHDILNGFYDFRLAEGVHNNRFEITFKDAALSNNNEALQSIAMIQNNQNQLLMLSNPQSLDLKSLELYDITGKLIFTKTNLGNNTSYEFSTASLSEAIYVVKVLTNDNQATSRKIMVERVSK